jgi:hypothetical protein
MNRLQKKCFIASAGTHLLLMLILFVGPAFLSAKNTKSEDVQLLDFIPQRTVDALVAPNPGGAPMQRPQQQPAAQRPPVQESKPPPAPARKDPELAKVEDKKDTDSLEVKPQKRELPKVSTTLTTRHSPNKEKQTEKSDNKEREREATDNRRKTAAAFANATASLDKPSSGIASVRVGDGNGQGTGVAYANFFQVVKTVYTRAWNVPDGASDGAVISVSVTIARNGDVVSSRITRRSGDSIADGSVEILLDRVRHVAPLPEDSKEDQRTVQIDFSVRAAKRLLG